MTTCMMTSPPARCTLPVGHDGPHATRDGYGWHDSDDMDGGVTAALIEKETEPDEGAHIGPEGEVDWHGLYLAENRRAEKAERDRDDALRRAKNAADQADEALGMAAYGDCHDCIRDAAVIREPRPLTPRQNLAALWESAHRPVGGRIPAGTAIITRSDYGNGDVRYQTLEATGRDLPDPGYTLERNYPYGPENGEEYRLLDLPSRPEGAEDIEATLFEWNEMDDNGDYSLNPDIIAELADHLARSFPVGSES